MKHRWARRGFSLLALAALSLYLFWHRQDLLTVRIHSIPSLVASLVGSVINLLTYGAGFYVAARAYDVAIPLKECLAACLVGSYLNAFLPARGGTVFRGWYFRKLHRLEVMAFGSILVARQFLVLIIGTAVSLVTLTWSARSHHVLRGWQVALIIPIGVLILVRIGISFPKVFTRIPMGWRAGHAAQTLFRLWQSPRALASLFLLAALQTFGSFLGAWGAYRAIGIPIAAAPAFLLSFLGSLLALLPLTTQGIGIFEAAFSMAGTQFAIPPLDSVEAVLISRLVQLASFLVTAPLALPARRIWASGHASESRAEAPRKLAR